MSVTITITVSPSGAAEVRTGADVTGEAAPPPSLLGGMGGTAMAVAAEGAAGPAPLEPAELGLGAAAETSQETGGPPPEDLEVAGEEADTTAEAPAPTPVEELE